MSSPNIMRVQYTGGGGGGGAVQYLYLYSIIIHCHTWIDDE